MKILLSFFFLFFTIKGFSQPSPSTFWKDRCSFSTDGTGKSLGLKIKLSVPCKWIQTDGERPHIVKNFSITPLEGSLIIETLSVNKIPTELTKEEIAETFSQIGLKNFCVNLGTFISGRQIKLDGVDCGEAIVCKTSDNPIGRLTIYSLYYFVYYKDKLIILAFSAKSKQESISKKLFENYKNLFHNLAAVTVLISKWE